MLWWLFYLSPEHHPWITSGELQMIEAGQELTERDDFGAVKRPELRKMLSGRRFWGIALPRFLAEPAWQTFNFWVPLYLSTQRGMNIQEIAMFAWLPFVAADLGSLAGAGLSPFFMKYFRLRLINSRLAGIVLGALFMIAPGCIGLAGSAYWAIALLCVGAFAHQIISSLINTLGTDVFSRHEVATANGFAGMASWTGGLSFSLVVGALADVIGYNPLFACLSVFDLIGAAIAILLLRDRGRPSPGIA
jgi:ACS family hexuronate transporter-like MFS transporter